MPVGTVVVPQASVAVTRNVDFDFDSGNSSEPPYRISKPINADVTLHKETALANARPGTYTKDILAGTVNASADRHTSFPDHNEGLIERLQASVPGLATLEMETFHLYHLAACWSGIRSVGKTNEPPLTTGPVKPVTSVPPSPVLLTNVSRLASPDTVIRAAAVHMVFASRTSQDFITPDQVTELERWTGLVWLNLTLLLSSPALCDITQGVLNALSSFEIPFDLSAKTSPT
ncbi:hypothetical protein H0H93_010642 [Arthromyces matolae]|nr:hypothetical protein H0H93_010642 [Arthromyces matolae]